jgi:cytochrome d ubiquinol oxidase subunit II
MSDDGLHLFLGNIWYLLTGLMLVLYVVLDGFDLGVGILTLLERDEERRGLMMGSLGSVWDANETWLVVLGGALFGAFPAAYAVVLHGLYIPIMAMLFGLILRGVAFEFREHARSRRLWNQAFGGGSLLAASAQGVALGALINGLPVNEGAFIGGPWAWLTPFSALVAAGVVCGYVLLGATYLIVKTQDELQALSRRRALVSAWIMLGAAAAVTLWTPLLHGYVARRWFSLPDFVLFAPLPLLALVAFRMLLRAIRRGYESAPFGWSLVIFVSSFVGLAASLYPYLVPTTISVSTAASSSRTLVFMLVGIGMLIPVMLVYNGYQYLVFRGKVQGVGYGRRQDADNRGTDPG